MNKIICPDCGKEAIVHPNGEIEVNCHHLWGIGMMEKYPELMKRYQRALKGVK